MGIDVGERRIGIAIADELGLIASPAAVVLRGKGDLAEIRQLATSRQVNRLIVGLPTSLSGKEGPQAKRVRTFADELANAVGPEIQVEFWDERLSTAVAERVLGPRGKRKKGREGQVDAMAAAVILQGYLDAQRNTPPRSVQSEESTTR